MRDVRRVMSEGIDGNPVRREREGPGGKEMRIAPRLLEHSSTTLLDVSSSINDMVIL